MTEDKNRHRWRPMSIFWPLLLITLGVLFLLSNFGIIPWSWWLEAWRLWPLILILIGIDILIGRFSGWVAAVLTVIALLLFVAAGFYFAGVLVDQRGSVFTQREPESVIQALEGVRAADVRLEFGSGRLNVKPLPSGSDSLMEGDFTGLGTGDRLDKTFVKNGDKGRLTLKSRNRGIGEQGVDWDVRLSGDIPLELSIKGGAAESDIDLSKLKVQRLQVDIGASTVKVAFPEEAGLTTATIQSGVSRIMLEIPPGVGAKIQTDGGLSAFDVASRFRKTEDTYISDNFNTATNRLELTIKTGLSSVTIK